MRYLICFLALWSGPLSAQMFPASNGGCSVSPTGVEGCNWMSHLPTEQSGLFVTTYTLAPGAPLAGPFDQDSILVAMSEGSLLSELKSPKAQLQVVSGEVFMMPRGEAFRVRNVGTDRLTLLLIQVRERTPTATATSNFQQHCASFTSSSFSNVSSAIDSVMSQPKGLLVNDSFAEKAIERSGDSSAVAIAKQVPDADLAVPYKMTRVLYILRSAFEYPDVIQACSDMQPRVTLLLLEHLKLLQKGEFESEIEKTKSLIMTSAASAKGQDRN